MVVYSKKRRTDDRQLFYCLITAFFKRKNREVYLFFAWGYLKRSLHDQQSSMCLFLFENEMSQRFSFLFVVLVSLISFVSLNQSITSNIYCGMLHLSKQEMIGRPTQRNLSLRKPRQQPNSLPIKQDVLPIKLPPVINRKFSKTRPIQRHDLA